MLVDLFFVALVSALQSNSSGDKFSEVSSFLCLWHAQLKTHDMSSTCVGHKSKQNGNPLKDSPSPFSDHLSSSCVPSPLPFSFSTSFFSCIHCQEGPAPKGQFSTTRRRQRLAAAVATTVSGLKNQGIALRMGSCVT